MILRALAASIVLFAEGADAAPNWEGVAEAGVLCRALIESPGEFASNNRSFIERYWPSTINTSTGKDGAQVLTIGSAANSYWVVLRERIRDGHNLVTCEVQVDPAYMEPDDYTIMRDWYLSWADSVVARGTHETIEGDDLPEGAIRPLERTQLNGRGCRTQIFSQNVPDRSLVRGVVFETDEVAGCGGASVFADVIDVLLK